MIDSGKVKETSYDPSTGMSRLEEGWVTKAAARQRRGRAGRTRPGQCYKLFTRQLETSMGNFPIPEILRVPLESLSLQIKVMREEEDVVVCTLSRRSSTLRKLLTNFVSAEILGQGY